MFRIRTEQYEALGKKTRTKFDAKLTRYFADHWREELSDRGWGPASSDKQGTGMDEAAIAAWVRRGVDKALRYKIDTEPETAQLLLLFLPLGADADETRAWVKSALADKGLTPTGKVRKLIEECRREGVPDLDAYVVVEKFKAPLAPVPAEIIPWDDDDVSSGAPSNREEA